MTILTGNWKSLVNQVQFTDHAIVFGISAYIKIIELKFTPSMVHCNKF
jgi:hypothetical protein